MNSQTALRHTHQDAYQAPFHTQSDTEALLATAIKHYQASSAPALTTDQVERLRDNACQVAHQVLQFDPTSIEALNILARVALDRNDLAQATSWANTAQALEPNAATTWFTLGHIHLAERYLVKAEKAFVRCIELDPTIFRAHTSYAYTKLQQGQTVPAFQHYRKLANIQPNDAHVRAKLFECLKQLKADYDNTELANSICNYLQWDDVNHNDLASICASLLTHRYQLKNDDAVIDIARLAKDPLLLLALEKLIFCQPELEQTLAQIRAHLLLSELDHPINEHTAFIVALAHQGYNNEYIYPVSEAEQQILDEQRDFFANASKTEIFRKQHRLLLLAMYYPPQVLIDIELLDQITLQQWQPKLQPLMQKLLYTPMSERPIKQLGEITNAVSCAVKAQYEHNPYPRWLALDYHTPTTYLDALNKALLEFKAPAWITEPSLRVLIAGCGTGRHALHIARYFRNTQVVAVDISHSSLQYAQTMAEHYNINNIEFLQADILDLAKLDQKFHIIECSGVLHHMQDPIQGARHLQQLLLPEGLMKVSLYSEVARKEVVECRELIEQKALNCDENSIRQLRQQLITDMPETFNHVLQSADFYTMSGCRDLLFHVQEHRFTPLQLQSMFDELNMRFLGFVQVNNLIRQKYNKQFPQDTNMLDLANWEVFEKDNPNTFSGMYQFYLQSN